MTGEGQRSNGAEANGRLPTMWRFSSIQTQLSGFTAISETIVDSSGVSLLIMPTVTLKKRPVQSWTSGDETSLLQVLGSLEYEPFASDDADSPVRHFQTQKLLPNDLWAESNSVLESLIPRLYCLFKFELTTESAKVSRWTQVTGQPWFDSEDGRF
jgi:hypothetical protein